MWVLLNDFLCVDWGEMEFVDLFVLVRECDIIIFYILLNRNGKYKMFYLVDVDFFVGL